jgi:integrase
LASNSLVWGYPFRVPSWVLHRASAWQSDDDLVFAHPHAGRPIDRSRLLKRFKTAITVASVGRFEPVVRKDGEIVMRLLTRFHDLRHTFDTRMAAAGVPMRAVQEWMGHRDFATTLIYADDSPSAHESAALERAFAAQPSSPTVSPATEFAPPSGSREEMVHPLA